MNDNKRDAWEEITAKDDYASDSRWGSVGTEPPEYVYDCKAYKEPPSVAKPKKKSTLKIVLIVVDAIALVALLVLVCYKLMADAPAPAEAVPTGDYLVRQSPDDEASELGPCESFVEACKQADDHDGYEVYDEYGNMLYLPEDVIANPTAADVRFRVRKDPNDYTTQIGAFANYYKALECVEESGDTDYKIYDMDGKLIYDPATAIR